MKDAPRYLAKVDHRDWFRRLIFWAFVRFVLNGDRYKLRVRYSGPRARWAHSTRRQDATGRRFYLVDRVEEQQRRERQRQAELERWRLRYDVPRLPSSRVSP